MSKTVAKEKKPHMVVYAITRGRQTGGSKDFFTPCGSAFKNEKDGSLTILLHRNAYSGELHVRPPKDKEPCWNPIPMVRYRVFELPEGQSGTWREVGVAFGNSKGGSLNVILNLIPEGSRLNVRLPKEAE